MLRIELSEGSIIENEFTLSRPSVFDSKLIIEDNGSIFLFVFNVMSETA